MEKEEIKKHDSMFEKVWSLLEYKSLKELTVTKENAFKIYSNETLNKLPKEEREDYRRAPLLNNVFKSFFENESNKKYTAMLISTITGLEVDYLLENMKFYKTDFNQETADMISRQGDLAISLNGLLIDVEMNNTAKLGRNFIYGVKMAVVEESTNKDVSIIPTIVININNYSYKEIDKPYSIYALMDTDPKYRSHVMVKTFYVEIYLAKMREKDYNSLKEEEKVFLTFFETSLKKAETLARGDEMLMEYNSKLKKTTGRFEYMDMYDKEAALVESGTIQGFEEGMKKGREKGIEQNRLENAKSLIAAGIDKDIIISTLKLTEDEIKKLM